MLLAPGEWHWSTDSEEGKYDEETSKILETAFLKSPEKPLIMNHAYFGQSPGGYYVDFQTMMQTQVATGLTRHIKRKIVK